MLFLLSKMKIYIMHYKEVAEKRFSEFLIIENIEFVYYTYINKTTIFCGYTTQFYFMISIKNLKLNKNKFFI